MNLFFEEPNMNTLSSALFYGWKNGLKTGSYYIRSQPKVQAQQFTVDPRLKKKEGSLVMNLAPQQNNYTKAELCARNNPESCEYCSG